jgi:hypothetical protein
MNRFIIISTLLSMPLAYAFPSSNPPLAQNFKQISVEGPKACGVDHGDKIYCTTNINVNPPTWTLLPGSLKQIDLDGDKMYGVNAADEIYRANFQNPQWVKLEGSLKHVSVSKGRACGVNAKDEVLCAYDIEAYKVNEFLFFKKITQTPDWKGIPGSLTQIDLDGDRMCGVNADNEIFCANYDFRTDFKGWNKKPGSLKSVWIKGQRCCGQNASGKVLCTNDIDNPNPKWYLHQKQVSRVTVFGSGGCVLNDMGSIYCPFV